MPCLRHAEFARGVCQRLLTENLERPSVAYFGLMFEKDGRDAETAVQQIAYDHFDASPDAPPKRREREPVPEPTLELLAWSNGGCSFPDQIFNKFTPGTKAYHDLKALKDKVAEMYPSAPAPSTTSVGPAPVLRAGGRPDYTIEGGKRPLDVNRVVDVAAVKADDFSETKQGFQSSWLKKL